MNSQGLPLSPERPVLGGIPLEVATTSSEGGSPGPTGKAVSFSKRTANGEESVFYLVRWRCGPGLGRNKALLR